MQLNLIKDVIGHSDISYDKVITSTCRQATLIWDSISSMPILARWGWQLYRTTMMYLVSLTLITTAAKMNYWLNWVSKATHFSLPLCTILKWRCPFKPSKIKLQCAACNSWPYCSDINFSRDGYKRCTFVLRARLFLFVGCWWCYHNVNYGIICKDSNNVSIIAAVTLIAIQISWLMAKWKSTARSHEPISLSDTWQSWSRSVIAYIDI